MNDGRLEVCSRTDIGLKRKRNEDSLLVIERGGLHPLLGELFAVADGMGGHPAGDMASRLACEALKDEYIRPLTFTQRLSLLVLPQKALVSRLKNAVDMAQKRLARYEVTHAKCRGFGTTLSALVIRGRRAIICHVGDSRIYRLRDGRLEQLTEDDTLVQEMVREGDLEQEEARTSPYRHVLTQALGGGLEAIHTSVETVRSGDTFLLSTDGLHDLVPHVKIKEILGFKDIASICPALVKAALAKGGKDNITVIVVKVK